jgi:hypothetical protein
MRVIVPVISVYGQGGKPPGYENSDGVNIEVWCVLYICKP